MALDLKAVSPDKNLWVLFDEINTSECLGTITEIITTHTFKGKPIADNIVIVATCNPYRLVSSPINVGLSKKVSGSPEKMKDSLEPDLAYLVKPLP